MDVKRRKRAIAGGMIGALAGAAIGLPVSVGNAVGIYWGKAGQPISETAFITVAWGGTIACLAMSGGLIAYHSGAGGRPVTAPPSRRPWWKRRRTWVLAIWFALPTLYVAATGPLKYCESRGLLTGTPRRAVYYAYLPYGRLYRSVVGTRLGDAADVYVDWWWDLARSRNASARKAAASD